ncbi:Protein trapped in endoderm-1 [Armadillidium nasatum]|uniref:Protein trapped in endoderm-1 n=1 Tax=Armadillidium nasatum TaxID=96803 RepID=A0A5N5TFR9_9CRUS|nr:Protein trapped in endoderm-1 [Armadillidium nasatum]
MNMVAITLNRYILIAHNNIYDKVYQRKNILFMIASLWTFCFGMLTPPLLGIWGTLGLDPPSFSCTILKKDDSSPKKFLFLFGFLFPCIAIVVSYTAIYYKVKKSRMKMASHTNRTPLSVTSKGIQTKKEDMRLTRMMLIIFLGFVFSFFPLMIVNVADDQVRVPMLHVLASVLAWASAVINPFVYAFTNRQYRTAYKKLFCSTSPIRPAKGNTHSTPSRTLMTEFQYNASAAYVSKHTPLPSNDD